MPEFRPRVLLNASTCVMGGGVQVAVGFLHHLHANLEAIGWDVVVVASPQVFEQCRGLSDRPGWRLELITPTPASVLNGRASRRRIHALIAEYGLEICFTVFGPSYLWLDIPELSGFADPSVTHPNRHYLRNHPWASKLRTRFNGWVKAIAVRRVRRFWVETETARLGLARRLGIDLSRIDVMPNAVNPLFVPLAGDPPAGRVRFLYLAAFYYHKNHAFLQPVAQALRRLRPDLDFEFVVTLPEEGAPWHALREHFGQAGLSNRIRNLGYLGVSECPLAYRDCHVIFHPSLLEVFSATYLEAFVSRRPVVATDLDFAREVCGDAALYFDPESAESAAHALGRAATDPAIRDELIANGLRRYGSYPSADCKNARLVAMVAACLSRRR